MGVGGARSSQMQVPDEADGRLQYLTGRRTSNSQVL